MKTQRANPLTKPFRVARDVVELYIPLAAFVVMFLTFILQIFFRYVLRQPLQWAYEVTVSCYLWLVLLGSCYAQRERKHVSFTMICDKAPVKPRSIMMFTGNLLMLIAFLYAFVPSVEFIIFMKRQQTAALKIGLDLIYLAYIPFMIHMMLYFIRDMITQARVFLGIAGAEEVAAFDRATREDYEDSDKAMPDVLSNIKEDKA